MSRSEVSPKEFIDAWKAEVAAGGTPEGVSERLEGRMSAKACVSRAFTYRQKRNVDLPKFDGGGRSYDWDDIREYAGSDGASGKTSRKKSAPATRKVSTKKTSKKAKKGKK